MVKFNSQEIWEFLPHNFDNCLNFTQKRFKLFLTSLILYSKAAEGMSKKIQTGSLLLLPHCAQGKCAGDTIKRLQTVLLFCVGPEGFRKTEQLAWRTNRGRSLSMLPMRTIIRTVEKTFLVVQSLTLIIKQMLKLSVQCRRKSTVISAYQVCNHKKSDIIIPYSKPPFQDPSLALLNYLISEGKCKKSFHLSRLFLIQPFLTPLHQSTI